VEGTRPLGEGVVKEGVTMVIGVGDSRRGECTLEGMVREGSGMGGLRGGGGVGGEDGDGVEGVDGISYLGS
jgi:hypothetical protein